MAGERVLVVDDETAISELVCEALKRQGFRVDTASDGDTALSASARGTPSRCARTKALIRRSAPEQAHEKTVQVGPLELDFVREEAFLSGSLIALSPTEYRLLEALARHPGRMVSRDELLAKVWGYTAGDTRTVDVHVFRLRRKIEADPENPKLLHTVRGRGFRLDWEGEGHEDAAR